MRRRSRRNLLPRSEIAAAREALAQAYLRTGDYDAVDRIVERAYDAARTSGDRRLEANALSVRGMTLHFRAIDLPTTERASIDPGPEESLFEQALALRRELGDTEGIAESLFQLGLVNQVLRRDLDAGAPFIHEALDVVATVPAADVLLRSEIRRHAGFDALLRRERRDEAREHLQASLVLRESLGERGWQASAHVALSLCERLADRCAQAVDHARRSLEIARDEGLRERIVVAAQDALDEAEALALDGPGA